MRYTCVEFIDAIYGGSAVDKLENFLNDNEIQRDEIVSISSSCDRNMSSIM